MKLDFSVRDNVNQLFPTPLGTFNQPNADEILPRIADVILARESAEQGVNRSNKGGWHSDDGLLLWPELEFADLGDTFRTAVAHMISLMINSPRFKADMSLTAWANVNRPGQFNSLHIHPGNHWSGVMYILAPNFREDSLPNAGNIEFLDPRPAPHMFRGPGPHDRISLSPKQGTILVFPSWLYHNVNPFSLDKTRISIAFNARINHFEKH